MKNKIKILGLIFLVLIICTIYYFFSIIYYLNRPYLTFHHGFGSNSLLESKKNKMYIGEYKFLKSYVKLKDGSILYIKNAWVEHQYIYKTLVLYFIQMKQKTKGFYIVIPPLKGKSNSNFNRLEYFLTLHDEDRKYTSNPGFGLSYPLGYQVYLDELPEKIRFDVIQKENENDSWKNAKVVDEIIYIRDFK